MSLHPFTKAMLDRLADRPALSDGSPDEARAMLAGVRPLLGEPVPVHAMSTIHVAGRDGPVRIRRIDPVAAPSGTIVFLHGGGWVVGALEDYDIYCRALAVRSGFTVLAVDYRLAPEHPYPAGLHDCEDALSAILDGGIPGLSGLPVVVFGDSAGGNLAAVLCRRGTHRARIAAQVLYYPVTDHDFDRPSYREHGEGMPLTAADMRWFFDHYAAPRDRAGPDIAVLHAADLAGMPPAIVVTAEYDVLRDEGEAFAMRLAACGVPMTLRRVPGVVHGFIRQHNLFDVPDRELSIISAELGAVCAPVPVQNDNS